MNFLLSAPSPREALGHAATTPFCTHLHREAPSHATTSLFANRMWISPITLQNPLFAYCNPLYHQWANENRV
uniref:Uncharacterized protein n=1 Tax=Manihot esculenta TaxID=3983 RepID=A0A2C9UVB2_MANES